MCHDFYFRILKKITAVNAQRDPWTAWNAVSAEGKSDFEVDLIGFALAIKVQYKREALPRIN
jgi:hypothetical protein